MASRAVGVLHRIERRVRGLTTRVRHRLGLETLEPGPIGWAPEARHLVDADGKASRIKAFHASFSNSLTEELEQARRLLNHDMTVLGLRTHYDEQIDWSRDPVSGLRWAGGYSGDIPYRGPSRLGDIKFPWELCKHQYFFTLGKAAWMSRDDAFSREIVRQIDHWVTGNPPHSGIHWISALEVGARAVSWMMSWPFYSDVVDDAFVRRMMRSLGQHMLFVERNLSLGAHANTHLVGEAAALIFGGLYLDSPHRSRWLATGLSHLVEQIDLQSRPDGGHVEQSPAYQRFFLDQYYLVDAILIANGRTLPPHVLGLMERMTDFLANMLFPDGSVPAYGDADDSRGIWCRARSQSDYRSLLALAAWRFSRGDLKAAAKGQTEELFWLYGQAAFQQFQALSEAPKVLGSTACADSGYYIFRDAAAMDPAMLVVDCGPLGYGNAGHGHADALSVQLYAGGAQVLTDAGTYSYNLDYAIRDIFKGTASHSTIVVDHTDQSTSAGRMAWSTIAQARCKRWVRTKWFDLFDGEHDGYRRLADPAVHRRVVLFVKPSVWLVADVLTARLPHDVELNYHVHPDCAIELREGGRLAVIQTPAGKNVCLERLTGADGGAFALVEGTDTRPPWYSRSYGAKEPGAVLTVRYTSHGAATLLTGIRVDRNVEFSVESISDGLLVTVIEADRRTTIAYSPGGTPIERATFVFEGDLLCLREQPGVPSTVWASNCKLVRVQNVVDISAPRGLESIELADNCLRVTGEESAIADSSIGHTGLRIVRAAHPMTSTEGPSSPRQ